MSITTIPYSARKAGPYVATAGQTSFDFAFPVLAEGDIDVYRLRAGVETLLTLDTDYTVTGAGDQDGGSIVLMSGAEDGDIIAIDGDLLKQRTSSYVGGTPFKTAFIDADLNRLAIMVQELARESGRSVRRSPIDALSGDLTLPIGVSETTLLALDNAGAIIGVVPLDASIAVVSVGSVDNAIIRANGTSGDALQGSAATIDDDGNIAGVGILSLSGNVTNAAQLGTLANNIGPLTIYSDKPSVLGLIEASSASPDVLNNDPVLWIQKFTKFDNGTDRFAHNIGGIFSDVEVAGQGATGATNVDGTWISVLGHTAFENANFGTPTVQDWDGFGSTIGIAGFARTEGYPGTSCVVTGLWGYPSTPNLDDTTFDNLPAGETFSTIGCEINIDIRHKDPGARTVVTGHGNTLGNYLFNFRTAGAGVRDWTFGQVLAGSPDDGDFDSIDPDNWNGFYTGILIDKIKSAGILMGQYFKSGAYGIKWPTSYPAAAMRPSAAMHLGDNQINLGQYTDSTFNDGDFWHNAGSLFFHYSSITNTILQSRSNVVTLPGTTTFSVSEGFVAAMATVVNAVNYFQLTNGATGNAPSLAAIGADTNIDLTLTPKGSGKISFGSYVPVAGSITGYIIIKDSGGTLRKIAVTT